jgi:nucleoside-diphosphate-sugar epimerase
VGDPAVRELVAGCGVVFHFAGVPDPARSRADPAKAVRENAGTTLNLLEACRQHGAGLVYPSTVRAAIQPPPDPYAFSKRLGEEACRLHAARATVVRLPSVFGPGQVAWEGATGAIARFAACALAGEPLVIPGDPARERDFVYVDDVVSALERIVADQRWNETITLASGVGTPLLRAAELVAAAVGGNVAIQTPGGEIEPGENESYTTGPAGREVGFAVRPLEEAIADYVAWLRRHPAAQGRARG